ncbi:hypothetical protein PP2015_1922 [Pseudoalteromonas phenolica]|uniref:Uncharacterized protein n=1 Tax=Pseudoalteromonas phenolica TaxID=161398 RepID=A0A0S2K2A1_9GAMM|nr:hypothetical protein PP2015_1922 [Pseudoalteromonas phenolica]
MYKFSSLITNNKTRIIFLVPVRHLTETDFSNMISDCRIAYLDTTLCI